ncbi:MAG TPA: cation:proton antiporter [Aquifex aeolicus]|nr:cation:proton antiporter [Aquifex aeolicus]
MTNQIHHIFVELAPYIALLLMFASAYLLRRISIPSIIAFMLVGFTAKFYIDPHHMEHFEIFKHAGIILLFFFIGLEYSFEKLQNMLGAWKTGSVDFVFNFIPPFVLAYLFGFDFFSALILAAVFYPSSTSIIAKLLMDYKRIASPEAEMLIGILIFEDLVAILLLAVIIPLKEAGSFDPGLLPLSLIKVSLALLVFWIIHRFLIPKINRWLDTVSEEEIFIFFALGIVLLVGTFFHSIGISEALGAFLLGVIVPETRILENIEKQLSDLKELSMGLFFFFFAYETQFTVPEEIGFLVVLIILGVILKIVSTYIAGYLFGLKKKTRFRASLSFVPRGEFSVIMSSFEPNIKSISIPFILSTAIIGSILFAIAPKIADVIYPPKKKKKKKPIKRPKKGYLESAQAFSEHSPSLHSGKSSSPVRDESHPS